MQLNDLKAIGAFVPSKLIERTVKFQRPVQRPESEWEHPDIPELTGELADESVTVWIRRGSAADAIEMMQAQRREQPFVAIFRSICHKDGTQVFDSVEQAKCFYESTEYQAARKVRENIAEMNMLVISGIDNQV